ncbi:alpha-1,2-fucosyltransferase [Patescibacteria group bacterium]
MIIVRVSGGLGNQMFQYALGRRLAHFHQSALKLDVSIFKTYKLHDYCLKHLNIIENIASLEEIVRLKKKRWIFRLGKQFVKQRFFHFDPKILDLPDNVYLKGYWQSERYFKDIEGIIRKDFSFKKRPDKNNKNILKKILKSNSVSIHVRRGDFVVKGCGTCGISYYKKAINLIKNKVAGPVFFVFSDDPDWCKVNLNINKNMTFVDFNSRDKNYEDLRLISSCKYNIICNSTFSWWGAWLNKNKNKIVIAPKKWFNNLTIDTSDAVPKTWLQI